MANRLNGKSAIVTGAASGMGRAITLAFLREGANVVACDLNVERLKEVSEIVAEMGLSDNLRTLVCNVTSNEDCDQAVKTCVEAFGLCNVLSHNAGIMDNWTLLHELPDEMWERQIAVNTTGSMRVTRAAVRYFVENEIQASIVMVTSNAATESCTGGVAYTASKAAANALMRSISYTYARSGIRCNAILPGPIRTNISESMGARNPAGIKIHHQTGYNAHCGEWMIKGKRLGSADDIANLAVFLASDESGFMTGDSITCDGGVGLGY